MVASSILYPLENLAEMHPGYIDSVHHLNFRLVIQTNAQSLWWLEFDIKFGKDHIQKRRRELGLFSFVDNLLPNLISNFYIDQA